MLFKLTFLNMHSDCLWSISVLIMWCWQLLAKVFFLDITNTLQRIDWYLKLKSDTPNCRVLIHWTLKVHWHVQGSTKVHWHVQETTAKKKGNVHFNQWQSSVKLISDGTLHWIRKHITIGCIMSRFQKLWLKVHRTSVLNTSNFITLR